jgi:hypothetical protein
LVTPKPPVGAPGPATKKRCDDAKSSKDERATAPTKPESEARAPRDVSPPAASPLPQLATPTSITVAHWGRLFDGELFAASRRIDWHILVRRTFGVDSLACPTCSGRMTVLSTIPEPDVVRKILAHLGLPTSPPRRAAARDPTDGQMTFDFDAA